MIITLNGADGSGKSTIINAVAEVTDNRFVHFHSRPGNLAPKSNTEKQRRYVDRPGEVPKRKVYLQVAKIGLFLAEFYSFAIWHKLMAGPTVVILERSLADVYVHPDRYGLDHWLVERLRGLLRDWYADLNIVLTGDAETMANRKQELPASEIDALNRRYAAALARAKEKVLTIDTTRDSVNQSQARIASRIGQITSCHTGL
ncbi:hypothetical protein GTA62_15595 [Roseobacter sp. HKCCD9010]|uniref:phosphotransferase-like protein n=1 Tax=unclassified Roseobacter TaxID=196798 RepID=UPI001492BB51|nr:MULTISPECIES: hypothetical protein [unclassified Roseobacter]MBF9050471.1 hypothetical protein [Rhodobacterales bacterium HKCCD4356]NNV12112.1 hypothetical protein [Roseobacter sp. HKCCD7357]NNV17126.1 hypothetical protein [Roseobacter sp. HKCCD8768]NNV26355.1 hypothetical protein [Roseobacter sp. HKCCD8192]NNV30850.1 hypothetical protein [Roseobacter sp. HKCCD9061]